MARARGAGPLGGLLLACLVLGRCPPAEGFERLQDAGNLPEYVVKAGFLYNFAKYVDWPASAFENATTPITIGIVGADPFGEELDKVLTNKTVKGRSFVVLRFREPGDIKQCHILFIPKTEKARLAEILKKAELWPVLTVGEDEGFAKAGGMVNILIEKEKPKLEVNSEATEKAQLAINSKLLKIATIVRK